MAVYVASKSRRIAARPVWPFAINEDHPLRPGLCCLFVPEAKMLWWLGQWRSMTGTGQLRGEVVTQSPGVYASAATDNFGITGLTPSPWGISDDLTIHVWVSCSESSTTRKRAYRFASSITGTQASCEFSDGVNNEMTIGTQDAFGTFPVVRDGVAPAANRLYGVTLRHRPGATELKLYRDGVDVGGAPTLTPGFRNDPIDEIYIGNNTTNLPFLGTIPSLMAWNRALTTTDIAALNHPMTRWDLIRPHSRRVYLNIATAAGNRRRRLLCGAAA